MPRLPETFRQVQLLKERFDAAVPGKDALIKIISEAELSEHVYNSNAIENSTLSMEETEKILLQIDLDRFVNEREIFEAKNLARVMNYVETNVHDRELDIETLLFFHKMLIANIQDDIAGRFRTEGEWVRVGAHIGADPKDVESLIEGVLHEYGKRSDQHIISRIATFHLTFESIHPFVDGNGRIGRVLNNYLLLREGYVPMNIAFTNRERYYAAFKEFDKDKTIEIMEEIVGRALVNSYHKRLAFLEGKKIVRLVDYAKETKQSHSNLINKAQRQTIEAFTEHGIWKIGVD